MRINKDKTTLFLAMLLFLHPVCPTLMNFIDLKCKKPTNKFFLIFTANQFHTVRLELIGTMVYRVMVPLMLGNGGGIDFGVSQCIPMGPCHYRCHLTLGVVIALDGCYFERQILRYMFVMLNFLFSMKLSNSPPHDNVLM